MPSEGRKAPSQFWQQFAPQQLKEILRAEANVTDFSKCTKKKDLLDLCVQNGLDKRVFDRWTTKFRENKSLRAAKPSSPLRARPVIKSRLPDPLQASRTAQLEMQSKRRPSLGVDPSTIFDTSESIADEESGDRERLSPAAPSRFRKKAASPLSRDQEDCRVKRQTKNKLVPRLQMPSRQRALRAALTARQDAEDRLASLRQSPLKTKRDYETAAAEHCLTASLQMLSETLSKPQAPPLQSSATFISEDGNGSVTPDLTPLLPQKKKYETPPLPASYRDELTQARPFNNSRPQSREKRDAQKDCTPQKPPNKELLQSKPSHKSLARDEPPRKNPFTIRQRELSRHDPLHKDSSREPSNSDHKNVDYKRYVSPADVDNKRYVSPADVDQKRYVSPADVEDGNENSRPFEWKANNLSVKTPATNSQTPAIVKRFTMANSAVRRRALAEAKLVKPSPEVSQPERTSLSGAASPRGGAGWLWPRVWVAGALVMLVVWLACGGVSGLGGWSTTAVRAGEPILFCPSSGGGGSRCVQCPVDAECEQGRARCSAYSGLTGSGHRWRCVSYKKIVYGIAAQSLPEIAAHLRAQDRKRSCRTEDDNGHFEDVWDLFDLYVAPHTAEMPQSWYVNPSLPSWGLENVEDSRRSDLMTIWYSDVLAAPNLAKHKIVQHETREYALGAVSMTRLWKCRLSRVLNHSFLISATLLLLLGLATLKRHLRKDLPIKLVSSKEEIKPAVSVSLPRRKIRSMKPSHL